MTVDTCFCALDDVFAKFVTAITGSG